MIRARRNRSNVQHLPKKKRRFEAKIKRKPREEIWRSLTCFFGFRSGLTYLPRILMLRDAAPCSTSFRVRFIPFLSNHRIHTTPVTRSNQRRSTQQT